MSRSIAAVAGLFALAGVGLAALGAVRGTATVGPDAVLSGGYRAVLADADLSWSTPPSNVWLSRLGGEVPVLDRALAVGDSITIAGKNGHPTIVEVTGLEQVDGASIGVAGVRLQLVTGRSAAPGEGVGAQMQFFFAVAGPVAPLPVEPGPARVL